MEFYSRFLDESTLESQIGLKKSTGELAILVALGLLGVYAAVWSQLNLPATDPLQPGTSGVGPRMFPQLSGVVMALTSGYLVAQHLWRQRKGTLDETFVGMKLVDLLRVLTFLAMTVVYFLAFGRAGFLLSTVGMLYASIRLLQYPSRPGAALAAVGFTLFVYFVFVIVLRLPVPDPLLGPLTRGLV